MGVIANGKEVATTTSGHIAHVVEPDFRIPPGSSPVGLWNEIASLHISKEYPILTEFSSGKIWTSPTQVGAIPSTPPDGFPGAKNGGLINSYACAAPGEGSPNVWVEGNQVLRFLDSTKQNAGNSMGIINDAAGAATARAAFKPVIPKAETPPPAPGGSSSKGKGNTTTAPKDQPAAPPVKKDVKPPAAVDKCTLQTAHMKDSWGREQDKDKTAKKSYIEVVGANKLTLTATIAKNCGAHPVWKGPEGEIGKGETATYTPPKYNDGLSTKLTAKTFGQMFGSGALMFKEVRAHMLSKPRIYSIQADNTPHDGNFQRDVHVFPGNKFELTYEGLASRDKGTTSWNWLRELFNVYIEYEVGKGTFTLKSEWRQQAPGAKGYRAFWYGSIGANMTILKVTFKKRWDFRSFQTPIPWLETARLFYVGINKLYKKWKGETLLALYIELALEGSVGAGGTVGLRRYADGQKEVSGTLEGEGKVSLMLSGNLDFLTDVIQVRIAGGVELKVTANFDFRSDPWCLERQIGPATLKGSASFKWDLVKIAKEALSDSLVGWMFGSGAERAVDAFAKQLRGSYALEGTHPLGSSSKEVYTLG